MDSLAIPSTTESSVESARDRRTVPRDVIRRDRGVLLRKPPQ